ncbi:DDE-type integrase/transposase/recombinase [Falsirhodobacter xinxiangensis]|uniref:DDE-type integrase/transposase/recombinase n=1 Tax=Falsirhodobacter xinxiangensis TaxID=2530049 RepID=UPI00145C10D4|nr:DDE-type integrase/transposase/recombinase [Rhodobacter xinxiangensis]
MNMNFTIDHASGPRIVYGSHDRITIENIHLRPVRVTDTCHILEYADGSGRQHQVSHEEMKTLASQKRIILERNFYHPEHMRQELADDDRRSISELQGFGRLRFTKRDATVEGVVDAYEAKKIKLTEESIAANMDLIMAYSQKYLIATQIGEGVPPSINPAKLPHPRTILGWYRSARNRGKHALIDAFHRRGNRDQGVAPEVRALMAHTIKKHYLNLERASIKTCYSFFELKMKERNEARKAKGEIPLRLPSLSTFSREINRLDPYQVTLARYGADVARKHFAPVGETPIYTRLLERVEIDEFKIDLMSLMHGNEMLGLTAEGLASLGLTGGKGRWVLTVAICCTTRCILGMKLSRTAKKEASLAVLEMVLSNKGEWIDPVGTTSKWNMFGLPEHIVTDGGSAFQTSEFRFAGADLGITVTRSVAKRPGTAGTASPRVAWVSRRPRTWMICVKSSEFV